jgi:hypothetical protein
MWSAGPLTGHHREALPASVSHRKALLEAPDKEGFKGKVLKEGDKK